MKKLIVRILVFLIPIFFLLLLFEYALRSIPNDYSYKNNYLDRNSNKLEVLFLGNSHIYYGIDPDFMKMKSFNASHVAQPIDFDFEILKKNKEKLSKLKYIVIPIDYFTFYNRLENGKEKWRKKNYNIYYGFYKSYNPLNYFEILNGTITSNYKRLENNSTCKNAYLYCNALGWGKYDSRKNKNLVYSAISESALHKAPNNRYYNSSIGILKRIISCAQDLRVKLILITCPVHKEYLKLINSHQMDDAIKVATSFSHQYPNVFYYNFLKDGSFRDNEFYDADHLNEIGARKFTFKIDSIIQSIEFDKKKKEKKLAID